MKVVYSVKELSELMGLSAQGIYTAVRKGHIPCIKIGGSLRFPKDKIDALLKGVFISDENNKRSESI